MNEHGARINTELLTDLPELDISQLQNWEDYFYKLSSSGIKLEGKSEEYSSGLGRAAWTCLDELILSLREDRVDEKGEPYIIPENEVTNAKVLEAATSEEKKTFFIKGFQRALKANSFNFSESDPHAAVYRDRRTAFFVAALAMAEVILKLDYHEASVILKKAMEGVEFREENFQSLLVYDLLHIPENLVEQFKKYIKFSQSQLTSQEAQQVISNFEEPKVFGDEPIVIGDHTFTFEGQRTEADPNPDNDLGWATLSDDEMMMIAPLSKATKRSRSEMIEQAREFAYQELGVERGTLEDSTPPDWFVKRTTREGIHSNQILVRLAGERPQMPNFIKKIVENAEERGHRTMGWFLLTLDEHNGQRYISSVNRLTS